jgi:hypothetical protein
VDPTGNLILASSRVDAPFRCSIESLRPRHHIKTTSSWILTHRNFVHRLYDTNSQPPKRTDVGDQQTGKTSIGVDTILKQRGSGILAVYAPIGQKASSILEVYTPFNPT